MKMQHLVGGLLLAATAACSKNTTSASAPTTPSCTIAAGAISARRASRARVGARLVVRRGARFVQPIFLGMAGVVILRLLWVNYGGR